MRAETDQRSPSLAKYRRLGDCRSRIVENRTADNRTVRFGLYRLRRRNAL